MQHSTSAACDLIPIVTSARDHLAGGPWSAFACWTHGALGFMVGDLAGARSALQAGVFEAELTGNPLTAAGCLSVMAIIDECDGDTATSAMYSCQAAEAISSCGAELLPTTVMSTAIIALHDARRGDREAALRGLGRARGVLIGFRPIAPWSNVITRLALVKTALMLDDRETARSVLLDLEYHARFDAHRVDETVGSAIAIMVELRAQVDAMHVPVIGSPALTEAELRVLQLLPTNLSLGDIASDLILSRNTVKSHTAAIYRKLGATKRREAVD